MRKLCHHCGEEYEWREWQRFNLECTPCRRERQIKYRAQRKAEGRPVVTGKKPTEYHREYAKTYNCKPEVRERKRQRSLLRRRYPNEQVKMAARRAVRAEIVRGNLRRQPCEVCGEHRVDAHHDDYGQPLSVRWLCRIHHRQVHSKATS